MTDKKVCGGCKFLEDWDEIIEMGVCVHPKMRVKVSDYQDVPPEEDHECDTLIFELDSEDYCDGKHWQPAKEGK